MYYHGALPIDFYYMCSHLLLYKGRLVNPVGDRFLFKIPGKTTLLNLAQRINCTQYLCFFLVGWSSLLEAFGVIPGTVQSCASVLREGNLLAISPGGVYEAQLGDNRYELLWKQRVGFAKAAIEARVVTAKFFIILDSIYRNNFLFILGD